jgi:hypothetical protein
MLIRWYEAELQATGWWRIVRHRLSSSIEPRVYFGWSLAIISKPAPHGSFVPPDHGGKATLRPAQQGEAFTAASRCQVPHSPSSMSAHASAVSSQGRAINSSRGSGWEAWGAATPAAQRQNGAWLPSRARRS